MLCEAFSFVAASSLAEPASARALLKVLDALEEKEGQLAFTAAQRRHMGVWRLTVIMPQQLSTDDSFMFNKSAKNVRELVEALPEVEDGENAALVHVTVNSPSPCTCAEIVCTYTDVTLPRPCGRSAMSHAGCWDCEREYYGSYTSVWDSTCRTHSA